MLIENAGGVKIAGFRGGTRNFFGHVSDPAAEAAFKAFLANGRFDAVHFQHTYHGLPLSLIPLAAKRAPLVCMTLHDFWLLCPRAHRIVEEEGRACAGPDNNGRCSKCIAGLLGVDTGEAELKGLDEFLSRRLDAAAAALAAAHVVAAPTRYVLGAHERAFGLGGKGFVSPIGLERVGPVARTPSERGVRFTFMGRINRLKNLRAALDAMRMTHGPAELNVWGAREDPLESARLARAVKADPRIRDHGAYDESDLPDILARTDVGLVPSLVESYSLVAREFLAAGVPVFAARTGGLPETVGPGRGGMLFDPDDPRELARLMREAIDDPGRVGEMAAGIEPIKDMSEDAAEWERIYASGGPA